MTVVMGGRRRTGRTSESEFSIASSLANMLDITGRTIENLAEGLHDPSIAAQAVLNRELTISSHISTTPTPARKRPAASTNPPLQAFREIGRGTCGQVFAILGTPTVVKLPINNSQTERLYQDCCTHKRIEVAFNSAPSRYTKHLSIPVFEQWLVPDAVDFWKPYGACFPRECPPFGLISERIFPLPEAVRQAIFRCFAPATLGEKKCLREERNKDCLVRIYMGRRMEVATRKEARSFGLRNFELHLNEMEVLGLPLEEYAMVMADAYAVMHWRAHVDGDDVEFVLGSAPRLGRSQTLEEIENESYLVSRRSGKAFDDMRRSVGMWLLDFNNCQRITLDGKGVDMLVRAFWSNDPYTPRPSGIDDLDAALWLQFRRRYLVTSIELLSEKDGYLAQLFIDGVEAEGEKWKARRATAGKGSLLAIAK